MDGVPVGVFDGGFHEALLNAQDRSQAPPPRRVTTTQWGVSAFARGVCVLQLRKLNGECISEQTLLLVERRPLLAKVMHCLLPERFGRRRHPRGHHPRANSDIDVEAFGACADGDLAARSEIDGEEEGVKSRLGKSHCTRCTNPKRTAVTERMALNPSRHMSTQWTRLRASE